MLFSLGVNVDPEMRLEMRNEDVIEASVCSVFFLLAFVESVLEKYLSYMLFIVKVLDVFQKYLLIKFP